VLLAASVAGLVLLGWLLPAGNQAYRQLMFALINPDAGARVLARGMNELTLGELMSKDAYQFHSRLALACAPLVLGWFALTIATAWRRTFSPLVVGVIGVTICLSYYVLFYVARDAATNGSLPAAVAGWAPNLGFVAMALLPLARKRQTNLDRGGVRLAERRPR
jgi:hypothetical protein